MKFDNNVRYLCTRKLSIIFIVIKIGLQQIIEKCLKTSFCTWMSVHSCNWMKIRRYDKANLLPKKAFLCNKKAKKFFSKIYNRNAWFYMILTYIGGFIFYLFASKFVYLIPNWFGMFSILLKCARNIWIITIRNFQI